jgi:5-methylcytosine-specific restriction endonuclease McrA
MKLCTKCKSQKSLSLFSTNKKAKDGLHSWCRDCVNIQKRNKQDIYTVTQKEYRAKNIQKLNEYDKKRRKTDSYKIMKSESDKKYREKMGEELKAKKIIYYSDKQHLRRAEYQRNKQGYIARAYQRLRNIKNLTPIDADKQKLQDFYLEASRLTECTGIRHEVDHIIPVSLGGLHHQDNLQVLPWIENRKKGNKLMEKRK